MVKYRVLAGAPVTVRAKISQPKGSGSTWQYDSSATYWESHLDTDVDSYFDGWDVTKVWDEGSTEEIWEFAIREYINSVPNFPNDFKPNPKVGEVMYATMFVPADYVIPFD